MATSSRAGHTVVNEPGILAPGMPRSKPPPVDETHGLGAEKKGHSPDSETLRSCNSPGTCCCTNHGNVASPGKHFRSWNSPEHGEPHQVACTGWAAERTEGRMAYVITAVLRAVTAPPHPPTRPPI
ncbi:hypothetical protein Taro_023272 [Colocasia esculenta]|uniref:Uncharacterized protein n=1 Tax=Colocasia esculenta TaxID=4460 RepID=A0A843V3R9_COLES|nr:hypothetical protein [Colocasia esculenta]